MVGAPAHHRGSVPARRLLFTGSPAPLAYDEYSMWGIFAYAYTRLSQLHAFHEPYTLKLLFSIRSMLTNSNFYNRLLTITELTIGTSNIKSQHIVKDL